MRTFKLKAAALALAVPGLAFAVPAAAGTHAHAAPEAVQSTYAPAYGAQLSHSEIYEHGRKDKRYKRGRGRGYDRYERGDYYRGGEPVYRNTRVWRGRDGQYYCRKENGTTGLLVGAAVGGLIGNEVAGRGDRTLGAILGAAGGAILGREIDRSNSRCR